MPETKGFWEGLIKLKYKWHLASKFQQKNWVTAIVSDLLLLILWWKLVLCRKYCKFLFFPFRLTEGGLQLLFKLTKLFTQSFLKTYSGCFIWNLQISWLNCQCLLSDSCRWFLFDNLLIWRQILVFWFTAFNLF